MSYTQPIGEEGWVAVIQWRIEDKESWECVIKWGILEKGRSGVEFLN